MTATVRRRPRRTVKAMADRLLSARETNKPVKPPRELLTVEGLRPIVDAYLANREAYGRWHRNQYTDRGRRKKGKALEKALALPMPPYPPLPLLHYELPANFKELPEEVQELWWRGKGFPPMPKYDEYGLPLNQAAKDLGERDYDDWNELQNLWKSMGR